MPFKLNYHIWEFVASKKLKTPGIDTLYTPYCCNLSVGWICPLFSEPVCHTLSEGEQGVCAVGLVHSMFPLWADEFQQCVRYLTDTDKGWLISIHLNILNIAKFTAMHLLLPSSSRVRVSAKITGALRSPRSDPTARSKFSSALLANWKGSEQKTQVLILEPQ